MDFARRQRDPTRHLVGITAVVLVHVVVVYALLTGLGTKAIQVIKKPLSATIVAEIRPPPPPPPPPPKQIELPKVHTPPPIQLPYVPPPEVPVPTIQQEPVIASVAPTPPPEPPVIAPPAPPAPPPPPAQPKIVRNPTILNSCSPQMPGEAVRRNIEGQVTAHLTVDEKGNVTDVKIVKASPPRIFDHAVVSALSQCKFPPSSEKWIAEVPLDFKLT